uniref:coatomer subunit gamma-1-like n=1 Tax=Podarcis muralis TaxID=64176 RepID=UPI0010A06023|nr:coatomer subunit gamma-1-like [Podarcis muralis]
MQNTLASIPLNPGVRNLFDSRAQILIRISLVGQILQLEDIEVTIADHIQRVLKPNFGAAWEEVGDEFEKEETFTLSTVKTLEEAVGNIVKFLGMQPCERSDKVPENKNSHALYLAGVFRGGHDLLVRSRLVLTDTVTMQVTARSGEELPVDVVMASVG